MKTEIITNVLRFIKYNTFFNGYKIRSHSETECFILGNGPALYDDIKRQDIKGKISFVVNSFANSDLYSELKPSYYVFADNYFWTHDFENTVVSTIVKKTEWNMVLFIPKHAYDLGIFQPYVKQNPKITLISYNTAYVQGYGKFQLKALKNNWGAPLLANVLVAALYLAINSGFKKINVLGADHSWTRSIVVNDQNQVCIEDTHFNSASTYTPWEKPDGEYFRMSEILETFARMFRGYEFIQKYSENRGVEIVNHTKNSFIDSFKRSKI